MSIPLRRREFLAIAAQAAAMGAPGAVAGRKTRLGVVHAAHGKLPRPASPEDALDYERVRDMVFRAIQYGAPRAGSLEAKIRPGSWVVIKPNIVFLKPQHGYRSGDITDLRVTRAVLEYVAARSEAARITIAEGGSYRAPGDPVGEDAVSQDGRRVNARDYDWGTEEFPGFGGTIGGMLAELAKRHPRTKFDFVDLSYDAIKDPAGNFRRIEVAKTARGVGAFGARPDYFVTNTIRNCDFLIDVPVAKVHTQCGITACMKNYVGTAPRQAYAGPHGFANAKLHAEHSVDNRIDPFIADLASFHPPDYAVVDGIRGLQYAEHDNGRPDQTIRNNLVIAGEDPVAADVLVAKLLGFDPADIEHLHMAAAREMGTRNLADVDVVGDEPDRFEKTWAKPRNWYGRANREWRVTRNPADPPAAWRPFTSPVDTLDFARCAGTVSPGAAFGAAVRIFADGPRKGFLWVGARGKVEARLNGQSVMQEENRTRYRVGQFRVPVELRSGENLLVFRVEALTDQAQISALIVGPENDGDSAEGIRYRG